MEETYAVVATGAMDKNQTLFARVKIAVIDPACNFC